MGSLKTINPVVLAGEIGICRHLMPTLCWMHQGRTCWRRSKGNSQKPGNYRPHWLVGIQTNFAYTIATMVTTLGSISSFETRLRRSSNEATLITLSDAEGSKETGQGYLNPTPSGTISGGCHNSPKIRATQLHNHDKPSPKIRATQLH